jgi:hypothetical protein
MASDRFRYDQYVDDALRGVARRVLRDVAQHGLTGTHHFYISFRTSHAGVEMPDYLRARYPEEITVVLQHQFWGLEITEEQFTVTVSFNRQNERLVVPFAALTAFVDPSVRFGLQFEDGKAEAGTTSGPDTRPPSGPETPGPGGGKPEGKEAEKTPPAGKVVTLDAFRKK